MRLTVGPDEQDHTTELRDIFMAAMCAVKVTIASFSEPAVFAPLTASPLPNLKELEVQEPLATKEKLSSFITLIRSRPDLCGLHFEGLYFAWKTAGAELRDLQEAAERHSLISLSIGIACSSKVLHTFTSHSYATLHRLKLEVTVSVSVDPSHLESLTELQALELNT